MEANAVKKQHILGGTVGTFCARMKNSFFPLFYRITRKTDTKRYFPPEFYKGKVSFIDAVKCV